MMNQPGERTLISALLSPRTAHIGTIISATLHDVTKTIELQGLVSSLVLDFYIKSIAMGAIHASRFLSFPLGIADEYKPALFVRTLQLNCLTKYYADLWQELWQDEYKAEQWSIDDPRLKPFDTLTREWQWATPLRNYFERRQALVEIDVIAAMALGLSLKDLEMIYSIQFPVLQQNEGDTWYDQKGNIVFTCSKGLTGVGCVPNGTPSVAPSPPTATAMTAMASPTPIPSTRRRASSMAVSRSPTIRPTPVPTAFRTTVAPGSSSRKSLNN